jgi:F-type H+-transporting ATPase subunit epsilon
MLTVHLVTPSETVWSGVANSIVLPTVSGEIGICQGHVALTALLEVGVLRLLANQQWFPFAIMGGFAQIEGDQVIVLSSEVEQGNLINVPQAEQMIEAAQQQFQNLRERREQLQAEWTLKRARTRLRAAQNIPTPQAWQTNGGSQSRQPPAFNLMEMIPSLLTS